MGGFFTDRALREVAAQASLITTTRARDLLHLSEQQWLRRKAHPKFPHLIRHGRAWLVEPHELLAYMLFENRLHAALSISQVSLLVKRTRATLRSMILAGEFPAPIGKLASKERFETKEVQAWLQEQRRRLPLPPELRNGKRTAGGG